MADKIAKLSFIVSIIITDQDVTPTSATRERNSPTQKLKSKIPITTIIQCVCDEFRCSEDQAKIKGRKNNKVRAIAMYLARDLSGVSGKDLGVFFDGISGAAITMKYNQINAELMRNKKLRDKITNLKKQLLNI